MSPSEDEEQFDPVPLLAVLERHRVEYIVVGGYAAAIYGATRPTEDIDIAPATTDENLARLAAALAELGARIRTDAAPEGLPFSASGESLRGLPMLNLRPVHGDLDLTFTPAGTSGFDDLRRSATLRSVGRFRVRVAALEDVIRSKEAAGRRKDQEALPELYRLAGRTAEAAPQPGPRLAAAAAAAIGPGFPDSRARAAARRHGNRGYPQ